MIVCAYLDLEKRDRLVYAISVPDASGAWIGIQKPGRTRRAFYSAVFCARSPLNGWLCRGAFERAGSLVRYANPASAARLVWHRGRRFAFRKPRTIVMSRRFKGAPSRRPQPGVVVSGIKDALFEVFVSVPGGARTYLVSSELRQLAIADPIGFASSLLGLSPADYLRYIRNDGAVQCRGRTKKGVRCQCMATKSQLPEGEWSALDAAGVYCSIHRDHSQ